jgi:hypothetical protein
VVLAILGYNTTVKENIKIPLGYYCNSTKTTTLTTKGLFPELNGPQINKIKTLAIATQLLAKIPYGVLSGISILKVKRSPILTVSTS